MRSGHIVYRFGAFQLDPASRRLACGPQRVHLTDPQFAVLLHLVANAPGLVRKEALADAGWGAAISDNSIEQAVSQLRKALGEANGSVYIETLRYRGYRFVAPTERLDAEDAGAAVDDEPFRMFVEGRRELATLNREAIQNARRAFARTIERSPDHALAHIGLANACALAFEATRVDAACDLGALTCAVEHARQATTLDPSSADAWSTLGFALSLNGETDAASVAAWKAVALERNMWRHWLRLAYVSWGDERIEAAQMALALRPDLALAYWLKGTVLIARGAFEAALIELRSGCAAQDKQRVASGTYPAVGLHLLHGLVLAAQDRLDEAMREFQCELAASHDGQLYSRECSANTWYSLGAMHLRRRESDAAIAAFGRALDLAPGHLFSAAALGLSIPALPAADPRVVDAAVALAVWFTRVGRHRDAAHAYREVLLSAHAPSAGWILPVEPILHVAARPGIWIESLTIVQQRAT